MSDIFQQAKKEREIGRAIMQLFIDNKLTLSQANNVLSNVKYDFQQECQRVKENTVCDSHLLSHLFLRVSAQHLDNNEERKNNNE